MIGRDARTGPYTSLDDVDTRRLIAALEAGGSRAEVAAAYGISTRTVYRYVGARIATVEIAGHTLPFLCRPGRPPIALSRRARR